MLATSIVLLWATHSFMGDDAHITFTYSRNLADGEGFVFNANDRTMSTTTPLTAIAMSIPSLLGLNLQLVGIVLSTAAAIVIAFVLYVNLEPLAGPIPATIAAVVSAGHLFVVTTVSNEMMAYTAIATVALHVAARNRLAVGAALAGMCTLIRPDGALVLALVILLAIGVAAQRTQHLPTRSFGRRVWSTTRAPLLAAVAVLGPWIVFATLYFGSPIPVTLGSKRAQRDAGLGDGFVTMVLDRLSIYRDDWRYLAAGVLAILGVWGAGAIWRSTISNSPGDHLRPRPELLTLALLFGWTFFYSVAYVVLDVTAYSWYAVPLVLPIAILTAAGSWTLTKAARSFLNGSPIVHRCLSIALLVAIALPNWVAARQFATRPPDRTLLYPETGEWFMVNVPPMSSIGTLEVGIIGYTAHRTIIDFAGLIQPDITDAADPALGFDGLALAAWQNYRPDFVAMLRPGISTITSDQAFRDQCRIIHSIEHPDVVDVMDVYACSDEPGT